MSKNSKVIGLAIAAVVAVAQANAATITGLYNTGIGSSGVLSDGTIGDPHYSLTGVPSGTTDIRVRTSAGGYPANVYIGDNTTSAWIGPNNDTQVNGAVGYYTYRTTFSLSGFDPSSATITGGWSTDNDGVKILLNGVDTGNPVTSFTQFSSGFAPFAISTGFTSGLNTLDFVVNNGGGPTALRVEMTGTATAVPEPSTYFAGMSALGMLCLFGKRNRK
jgi:hypothetical protein